MDVVLIILGGIVALVGYVWILVAAFTENVLWGVACFLLTPVAFVIGILKWDELKVPTIMMAAGVAVHVIGRVMA